MNPRVRRLFGCKPQDRSCREQEQESARGPAVTVIVPAVHGREGDQINDVQDQCQSEEQDQRLRQQDCGQNEASPSCPEFIRRMNLMKKRLTATARRRSAPRCEEPTLRWIDLGADALARGLVPDRHLILRGYRQGTQRPLPLAG